MLHTQPFKKGSLLKSTLSTSHRTPCWTKNLLSLESKGHTSDSADRKLCGSLEVCKGVLCTRNTNAGTSRILVARVAGNWQKVVSPVPAKIPSQLSHPENDHPLSRPPVQQRARMLASDLSETCGWQTRLRRTCQF